MTDAIFLGFEVLVEGPIDAGLRPSWCLGAPAVGPVPCPSSEGLGNWSKARGTGTGMWAAGEVGSYG